MNKLLLVIIFITIKSYSQEFEPLAKLSGTDRAIANNFGRSVSVSGDYMVVGMPNDDLDVDGNNSQTNAGSAVIYKKLDGVWILVQKIVASDRSSTDYFGSAVSILGEFLIIGAYYNETDEFGNNNLNGAGAAYIFKMDAMGTWNQIQKIVALQRSNNGLFGTRVLLSGEYAFIGCNQDNYDSTGTSPILHSGAVYSFKRNIDGVWLPFQKIVASDRAADKWFGIAIAINGNQLIVGSVNESVTTSQSAGAAYLFQKNSDDTWTETQKIISSDLGNGDKFGREVSITSNYIFVTAYGETDDLTGSNSLTGAGACYIFENIGDIWTQTKKIVPPVRDSMDIFGNGLFTNGDYAVIGAPGEADDVNELNPVVYSGSAYIYKKDDTGQWNFFKKLKANDEKPDAWFGRSFAMDDNILVVAAPLDSTDESNANYIESAGSVYLFSTSILNVAEHESNSEIVMYPNPTSGNFSIELGKSEERCRIEIYNLFGQLVTEYHAENVSKIEGNINEASGMYIIKISTENKSFITKIIKY
ncbi:MAG: T9SS type A sorting domain-containing protein [Pedobacter sp.]|nr:MAG: T9SS type A sorting domain-containing protein [Pedobacter sp.]